jgi:hypothetical protein
MGYVASAGLEQVGWKDGRCFDFVPVGAFPGPYPFA